jgi:MFS family permease
MLGRSDIAAHFAAFVLVTASVTIGMMNLPLFILHTLRGTEANVGTAYSVAPVFELPFMLYFGWLATRFPPARIIRVGMGISLAYYASLTLVTAPWHVYLCQGLSAAATSILAGVAITYFSGALPAASRYRDESLRERAAHRLYGRLLLVRRPRGAFRLSGGVRSVCGVRHARARPHARPSSAG